ncbi:putative Gb2-cadherin [Sesbania bispinosa]|nr:putative Gb2-cadherin [Sesbania bispinosa]
MARPRTMAMRNGDRQRAGDKGVLWLTWGWRYNDGWARVESGAAKRHVATIVTMIDGGWGWCDSRRGCMAERVATPVVAVAVNLCSLFLSWPFDYLFS